MKPSERDFSQSSISSSQVVSHRDLMNIIKFFSRIRSLKKSLNPSLTKGLAEYLLWLKEPSPGKEKSVVISPTTNFIYPFEGLKGHRNSVK